jgi:PEP-CTERM motif
VLRRRRTRRHRRNRVIRRVLFAAVVVVLGIGISAVALRYLSPSLFHASKSVEPDRQATEASRFRFVQAQQDALRSMEGPKVYPYSVVPGGVRDARELKWAADHDPVVAAHYRGFDYDHARVVRLVLARTVYVSYRIGNKIYWTRHRIKLKKGETVITDGKITARTRCANRVEEMPKQATSSSEPPAVKFEQPVMPSLGPATQNPPVPFVSSLITPPGVGPSLPLSTYSPFQPGIWVPIYPPPLPGVCGVGKKKTPDVKKRKGGNPCGNGGGGGQVPEPGTWLLMASGLAGICWIGRRRFARNRLAAP